MTHFVRPLVLADALRDSPYEIHFYAPSRYARFLAGKPFLTGELDSMSGELFLANLAKGAPLFPASVIRGYVEKDRELLRKIHPDLVVGDMRLSLPISARLEGIPCAVLFNAHWSPYTRRRFVIPSLPVTRLLPPRWFYPLYKLADPLVNALHTREMNVVRRDYGMPPLPPDIREMYTDGDYVLYPDVPEYVPTTNLPSNHHYIGICEWNPPTPKPEWWDKMLSDPRPKVFVSLGSSGPLEALPPLLRALAKLPVAVMISTSGRSLPAETPDWWVTDLLPFTETARESRLVITHGGIGGIYPALAAGTPILGIPSNADQHLSTAILEESGAGLGVRVEEATEPRLFDLLQKLLSDSGYLRSAEGWARVYARYDSGALFREFVSGCTKSFKD